MNRNGLRNGYMTVAEFSEHVEISATTLRYYDKIGIFRPAKRGVDFENMYRLYDPAQITTIKFISVLKRAGVSLESIKALAEKRTPNDLIQLLSESRNVVADKRRLLDDDMIMIDTFISLMVEGISINESDLSVLEMPERMLILGHENQFGEGESFHGEFVRFRKAHHEPPLNMAYPIGAYWPDIEEFTATPSYPTRFFSVDPNGNDRKKRDCILSAILAGTMDKRAICQSALWHMRAKTN